MDNIRQSNENVRQSNTVNEDVKNIEEPIKPFSVASAEFTTEVYMLVNKYGFDATVAELLLRGIYLNVKSMAENQMNTQREEYYKKVNELPKIQK